MAPEVSGAGNMEIIKHKKSSYGDPVEDDTTREMRMRMIEDFRFWIYEPKRLAKVALLAGILGYLYVMYKTL